MSINIKVKNITEEQYNHFFNKWLYTYGGATDVVSLEDYIKDYDVDWYGDIDIYSSDICPCVMCFDDDESSDTPNPNADYIFVFEDEE
jgi:hypothetical protein